MAVFLLVVLQLFGVILHLVWRLREIGSRSCTIQVHENLPITAKPNVVYETINPGHELRALIPHRNRCKHAPTALLP